MPRCLIVNCTLGCCVLLLIGCTGSPTPEQKTGKEQDTPPTNNKALAGMQKVTLHVPEMAKRLNLVWDAWPNRVEKALLGLSGVESVDQVDWDKDWLHVQYDASKITVEALLKVVTREGFEGKVVPKK